MEAPLMYSPLVEPRHIRLLQVTIDQDFNRAVDRVLNDAKKQVPGEEVEQTSTTSMDQATPKLDKAFKGPPRIRGHFVLANLDNLPHSYKAISYFWGSPETRFKVWIDDSHYLEITQSAMEILIYIVTSEMDDYFWIDAICINQKDKEEKGRQVRLMHDVYSRAEEVVAWTGRPSNDTRLAFEFISTLNREIERLEDGGMPLTKNTLFKANDCDWPSPKWTALARFLRRPFFRRVWIVQEMVTAKQIRLTCGTWSVEWWKLGVVILKIEGIGMDAFLAPHESEAEISIVGARNLATILRLRYRLDSQNIPHPLLFVLSLCQSFGATDPRDRIFALLNVSSDTNDEAFAPDYNKLVEVVFADATRHMLTKTNPSISVLYSASIGYDRALGMLPSWVPDWSTERPCMSFGITPEDREEYHACGKDFELTIMPACSNSVSVSLKGRIIDTVKSCYDKRPEARYETVDGAREAATRYTEWLVQLCHIFPDKFIYPTGAPFFPDVLSHTLVAGRDRTNRLSTHPIDTQFVDFFAMVFLSSDTQDDKMKDPIPELIAERAAIILTSDKEDPDSSPISQSKTLREAYESSEQYDGQVKKQRKIFTTEKNYVGLGPLLMQENDIICLIYGARVPFLIRRRVGGGYLLVGECYVHGLMRGEGMSMGVEQDVVLY